MKKITKLIYVSILLFSATTSADTFKAYPGSTCVRFSGGSIGYWNSHIVNNGSSVMKVDCPIERNDYGYFLGDPGWLASWFIAKDQSDDQSVRCRTCVLSAMPDSSLRGSCTAFAKTGNSFNSTNYKRVYLKGHSISNEYDEYSYAYLSCEIPKVDIGKSMIASYQLHEYGYPVQ